MEKSNPNPMLEIIVPTALVDIKMSSGYYKRIQDLVGHLIAGKTADELKSANEQIKNQKIEDSWVEHYETMLILCKEFEERCKEQGFTKQVTPEEFAEMMGEA
jgi:hypothetical protein